MKELQIALLGRDFFIDNLAFAMRDLGCSVTRVESTPGESPQAVGQRILALKPDLTLCYNYNFFTSNPHFEFEAGFELKSFLEKNGICHVSWQLDNPRIAGKARLRTFWEHGYQPQKTLFAVLDRAHIDFYQSRGVPAILLSSAVDKKLEDFEFDVSRFSHCQKRPVFVGTAPNYITPPKPFQDVAEVSGFFSFQEMSFLLEALAKMGIVIDNESQKQALFAAYHRYFKTYCCHPKDYETNASELYAALSRASGQNCSANSDYLDMNYSYCQLMQTLKSFLDQGLVMFGGDDWKKYFGDYQVAYPRVDIHTELPNLLHASQIVLCLTKWQYRTAMHDRPIMALACGSFPLTDWREDVAANFAPDELVCYRSLEEAHELAGFYSSHDAARLKVVAKGRERVFAGHTYHHRAQTLIKAIQEHLGL